MKRYIKRKKFDKFIGKQLQRTATSFCNAQDAHTLHTILEAKATT